MVFFNFRIIFTIQFICLGFFMMSCDTTMPPSGEAQTKTDGGSLPDELRGPCSFDKKNGVFEVSIADSYSSIGGQVASGVVPSSIPHEKLVVNECRLLQKINPECTPACESGEACNLDGECIPYPKNQNAGVITVEGLQEKVTMNPLDALNYFVQVSHPIFLEGSEISLTSTKGYAGEIKLYGEGVKALEVKDDQWTLAKGEPLTVNWTPPAAGSKSRILINMNVDQHGSSPYRIYCDVEDTGSYVIPAQVIDELMKAGISGFPNGRLTRRTVDSVKDKTSCIEFIVSSPVDVEVRVDGVTPCNSDKDCPSGQVCNMVSHLCEKK